MKLNVSKKSLTAALKAVIPAVSTRPGLPILACVRLDGADRLLSLKTTDLELAIEQFVKGVSAERPGCAIVPAKALAKVVQAMPGHDVTLESTTEDGRPRLKVQAGSRTVTLDAYPEQEWPEFPSHRETALVAGAGSSALADALGRCALCASADEARPILTAVALSFEEDSCWLEVVATDSYRLGLVSVPLAGEPSAPERPLLIPARVAKALAKRLKGESTEVCILRENGPGGQQRVVFSFGEADWWVRTIEGEFPNWRQVMPEAKGALLEFDSDQLGSALKAALGVWKGTSAPSVKLSLDRSCTLVAKEPDLGAMRETLRGASFTPNGVGAIQVAFNPAYLADAIRFCETERGQMWVKDGLKPALFEGPDRSYALMPIRPR